jgi:hypothetical protein
MDEQTAVAARLWAQYEREHYDIVRPFDRLEEWLRQRWLHDAGAAIAAVDDARREMIHGETDD